MNQAEADGHVTPTADENRGVVAGAQGTTMSGSRQFLEKPNHIGMGGVTSFFGRPSPFDRL